MTDTSASTVRHVALQQRLLRLVPLLALAGLWEVAARVGWVDPWLLPPVSTVAQRGWQLLCEGMLMRHLLASALRVLVGFGIAMALALPIGVAMGLAPAVEAALEALLSLLRPLSPPAWIPLAILWFGIGDLPAVFIIFVGTFFSLLVGISSATRALDAQLVRTALSLGATRRQTLGHVILPALVPALVSQTRLGLGLAWMCVIAAEMVAVRQGIGYFMSEARHLFRTADVLVGMITVGITGVLVDWLIDRAARPLLRHRAPGVSSYYQKRKQPWANSG